MLCGFAIIAPRDLALNESVYEKGCSENEPSCPKFVSGGVAIAMELRPQLTQGHLDAVPVSGRSVVSDIRTRDLDGNDDMCGVRPLEAVEGLLSVGVE